MRGKKCSGGKHSKLRLTGFAVGNALGEKLPLFIFSKSQKPRCFKHIKTLPCRYRAQKKNWINGELFEELSKEVDKRFQREGMNVSMIMDNCSAHPDVEGLKAIELKRLPSNTTSNTQPSRDHRSLNAKYRHFSERRIIRYLDSGKPLPTTSMLDAMNMLVKAWNAVEEKTIVNCFRKAGISPEAQSSAVNDDDDPFKDIEVENDTMAGLQHALDALHPDLVSHDANAEELVNVDAEVETSGPALTEAEIVAEMLSEGEEQDDGDEDKVVGVHDDPLLPHRPIQLKMQLKLLQNSACFTKTINCDGRSTNSRCR